MTTSGPADRVLVGDAETRALGARLGATVPDEGAVLALSGQLGAGKTTLVKGLAEGMGVATAREVTSPTFLRMVRFDAAGGGLPLVHVDAYRMKGPGDAYELGLEEDLAGGACVAVEWPERVAGALPDDHLRLEIDHVDESRRRVRFKAGGTTSKAWLERACPEDATP